MQLRWSKRPPITSPWQAPTEIVKSSIFSQSQRRNLILQCGALVFWKMSHFSSESCGPYLIRILSQGKPSGGQRFTDFAYSVEEEMGTVTVTVSVWHIHMPTYREESGRELLCILREDRPGAQGGGLCEASHCYMMPEGGYQSNGSQDTQ